MIKAYSYIRFSTPEQSKGDSLRRQIQLSEDYAKRHDLELDRDLSFKDLGISAYDRSNVEKGALGKFLTLVKDGTIAPGSFLLVESLDRLSRAQILPAQEVFLGIINAGITIVTLGDNIVYSKDGMNQNSSNLIMSIIIMTRAADESATKSRRGQAAWENKRAIAHEKRVTKRCPYWLKPSETFDGFEVIPDRVLVVERILNMAKEGLGNSLITKKLNAENVPTFSAKTDGWQESYVQKIFSSPALYGALQMSIRRNGVNLPQGDPIENYYPAIITKEEWQLINANRSKRRQGGGAKKGPQLSNLFSGLLFCGHCDGTMVMGGHAPKPNQLKSKKFVGCYKARRGMGCSHTQWNYDHLEEQLLTFCRSVDFAEILNSNHGLDEISQLQIEKQKIQNLIDDVKGRLEALARNLEEVVADIPSILIKRIQDLENHLRDLKSDNDKLDQRILYKQSQAQNSYNHANVIGEITSRLKNLAGDELLNLRAKLADRIQQAILKIILYPAGQWIAPAKLTKIRSDFEAAGVPEADITNYFKDVSVKNKKNRFMTIIFHNGESLRIDGMNVSLNIKPAIPHDDYRNVNHKLLVTHPSE